MVMTLSMLLSLPAQALQLAHGIVYRRGVGRELLALCLCLLCVRAEADDGIQLRAPYVTPVAGVYVLTTHMSFMVPDTIERSVHDGATLNLELQIRVSRSRTWWRDERLADLTQRYSLIYHSVSERYLVRNLNSGAQSSYASFEQAIASLQDVVNLPVLDRDLITPDARNEMSVRATVSVRSIPRVLGLLLFWVDNFALESDWYTWPMKP